VPANNYRFGIEVGDGSRNNLIERNSVQHVGNYRTASGVGVILIRSAGTAVRWNSVLDNQAGGIVLLDSDDTLLANNVASDNGRGDFGTTFKPPADGISVDASSDRTVIRKNTTDRNTDDGIGVDAEQTTFTANLARDNADLGIEAVPGVIDGGGNRAFGNGNPLQCLNVVCK
jgi:parallel beta-helix repeat protein